MDDAKWSNATAGVAALGVIATVLLLGFALPSVPSTNPSAGLNSIPTVYRNLTIAYSPTLHDFGYSATLLNVPLHTRVMVTIVNYDPSTAELPTPSDAQVAGTEGGTMTWTDHGVRVTSGSLSASAVSHTFTMSDAYHHLNVPIPPAGPDGSPAKVTFSVVFTVAGTFAWGCVVICGGPMMAAADSMNGSLTAG